MSLFPDEHEFDIAPFLFLMLETVSPTSLPLFFSANFFLFLSFEIFLDVARTFWHFFCDKDIFPQSFVS